MLNIVPSSMLTGRPHEDGRHLKHVERYACLRDCVTRLVLGREGNGQRNFNRTAMLYALMQSRGVRPAHWCDGIRLGAAEECIATGVTGDTRLYLSLTLPSPSPATIRFDYARHRRVLNLDRNYVRLNEFPEWFIVDENTLYRVHPAADASAGIVRIGSELIAGIELTAGDWVMERVSGS
jgi:hypothetical protein